MPVLQGVDVVAYFDLAPGSPPVHGSSHYSSEYMGYTFWFSSQQNKETFEVGQRRVLATVMRRDDSTGA